ncbi:MAG: hypothetical protein ACI4K7_06535 [Oscillospiraceae bacterium]
MFVFGGAELRAFDSLRCQMLRRPDISYFSFLFAVNVCRPLFYTGGALLLFVASAFGNFRGQMSHMLTIPKRGNGSGASPPTKGRRHLETRSLERLANFLLPGYCLFAVTLSLEPSFAIFLLSRGNVT